MMQRTVVSAFTIALLVTGSSVGARADEPACPWQQDDPTDEIGASRTQTPQKVLQAIRLVKHGHVYRLAHDYDEENIPKPFGREFDVEVSFIAFPEAPPSQAFHVGVVGGEIGRTGTETGEAGTQIGQLGTQFDALGHAGHADLGFYNCIQEDELGPDELGRLKKLGTETVQPFFTRGILLDFVNHSSVPKIVVDGRIVVEDSFVIQMHDVWEVLHNQRVEAPHEGDVVLFRTGWDAIYGMDNDRLLNAPGPGTEVADWLAERKVALVGADTMSVEAIEGGVSVELVEDPDLFGPEIGPVFNAVHFILLTQNGIHLLENMRLHQLADDLLHEFEKGGWNAGGGGFKGRRGSPYEFLFTFAPVPFKGLAGSPGQPLAVY